VSIEKFLEAIDNALMQGQFIRLAFNHYKGIEPALKKTMIRRIILRGVESLSFTSRYQTRDIVKNYPLAEAVKMIADMATEWDHAILYTPKNDILFERKKQKILLRFAQPTEKEIPIVSHDKEKTRLIKSENAPYLTALKLADSKGQIFPTGQDKFRQINKFIEIFASLVDEKNLSELQHIVDMGSGKGYLTFALYDYLTNQKHHVVQVTGVEYRQDMVDLCNRIADETGFEKLQFVQGTIQNYRPERMDALIALHACDTATDEAIAGGIKSGAQIILCAPCCHKQIRREIEKNKAKNDLEFLTQYGTFLERQAEMVTDGIRALILNYYGYKTKVFEFISDAHTPKNVMITAVKSTITEVKQQNILQEIRAAKAYFGITQHHLEKLLEMEI